MTRPKKSSHSFKQYDVVPSSASDHYSDPLDDPQPAPSRPKKHSDKSKRGPDSNPHLQRRISHLNIGIGLLSLLGSLTLIRTIHNMTLTLLTTGKKLYLTSHPNMQRRWIRLDASLNCLILGNPYLGLPPRSWALMMKKAGKNLDQEALP